MINFLKYRFITAAYSILLIGSFIGVYLYKEKTQGKSFVYSIDFTGGTQVLMKFSKPTSLNHIREILEKNGWDGATLREFGKTNEVMIRVKEFSNDAKGLGEHIRAALQAALPDTTVEVEQSEGVGAGVGAELRWKSIRAVLIALAALLLYSATTFWSFAFGVGAVAALIHDALVMLAAILFLQREVSMVVIGAILAVLGYSINDTIVIFDRIRENLKKMRGVPLYDIVNTSINQTMRRTLLTSSSTALAVLAMLLLGGEVLRDFSLILLIGIVFGTYSSVYIASPIMMLLYKEKE